MLSQQDSEEVQRVYLHVGSGRLITAGGRREMSSVKFVFFSFKISSRK